MNADNMDGYGVADLAMRHAFRLEGARRPTLNERKQWAQMQQARQQVADEHDRNVMSKFGVRFGRPQ